MVENGRSKTRPLSTQEDYRIKRRGRPKYRETVKLNYKINRKIRAREVMLVGADGNNVGVVPTREALQMAYDAELDLVEVAPNAKPPVCRIMDYGKFAYDKSRQFREAKKKQTKVETKSIRMRPGTSDFHLDISAKKARRWLDEGKKVQFNIRFRGREIASPELGKIAMEGIAEQLADVSVIEQKPTKQGWTMSMTLIPTAMAKGAAKGGKSSGGKGGGKPRNDNRNNKGGGKPRNDNRNKNNQNKQKDVKQNAPPKKQADKKDGESKDKEVQNENV